MTSGLELRGVSIRRDGAELVTGLDWLAAAGTIVAIIGSAGSGKSSLLAALAGRIVPVTGTVTLHGIPVGDARLQGRVGIVTQSHELVPTLTATENVALAALADEAPPADAWQHSRDLLDRLDLPVSAQANLAEELSGGQHQRVAVARAVAADPALVLADDPTSELDASSTGHVLDALRDTAATGAIVVVATNESRIAAHAELIVQLDEHAVTRQNVPAHEPASRSALVRIAQTPRTTPQTFLPGQQIGATGAGLPRGHRTASRSRRARTAGATVLLPWDTTELATRVGQEITVLRLDRRTGWALCRAADGTSGRVPVASLDIRPVMSVPSS